MRDQIKALVYQVVPLSPFVKFSMAGCCRDTILEEFFILLSVCLPKVLAPFVKPNLVIRMCFKIFCLVLVFLVPPFEMEPCDGVMHWVSNQMDSLLDTFWWILNIVPSTLFRWSQVCMT